MRGANSFVFPGTDRHRQTWCIIIIAMNLDKNDYDSNAEDAVVAEAVAVTAKRL